MITSATCPHQQNPQGSVFLSVTVLAAPLDLRLNDNARADPYG
jgi:hypothetical protein